MSDESSSEAPRKEDVKARESWCVGQRGCRRLWLHPVGTMVPDRIRDLATPNGTFRARVTRIKATNVNRLGFARTFARADSGLWQRASGGDQGDSPGIRFWGFLESTAGFGNGTAYSPSAKRRNSCGNGAEPSGFRRPRLGCRRTEARRKGSGRRRSLRRC